MAYAFDQLKLDLKAAVSWSGGKDSCLACYKALEQGYKIKYLFNTVSKKHQRCCFHGISRKLMSLQADLINISLFQKEVSPDMKLYETEFKEAINHLKKAKIKAMIFGNIYLTEHKTWVERVCKELNIKAIEPLWRVQPEKVLQEFIGLGFKAVVVSAKAELFGKDFLGREVDLKFLKELKKRKICPCGENGEFHTLVVDGPLFRKGKIEITKSRVVFRRGFWPHWFLDIQDWRIKN